MSSVKRWRMPRGTSVSEGEDGEFVLASDYDTLTAECERLRLDNLSKNGSMKAFGEQIAALQRAVKNRDKLKARAETERDAALAELAEWAPLMQRLGDENQRLRDELAALKGGQEPVMWVHPNVIGADLKINWPTAITFSNRGPCRGWTFPLYAAPPAQAIAWVPEGSRKVFICRDCDGVYSDEPVSQCDCMGREIYDEGYIVMLTAPPAQASAWPEWMASSGTFVDRLHLAGWRDHADAQHAGAAGMYDQLLAAAPTPGASDGKGGDHE